MASSNQLREDGKEAIKQAQQCERDKQWTDALAHYVRGIEALQKSLKYEPVEPIKKAINERLREYVERAEHLKQLAQEQSTRQQPPAAAAAAASPAGNASDLSAHLRPIVEAMIVRDRLNVAFSDVAGLDEVKSDLRQAVVFPLQMPQMYETGRVTAYSGIMLYGPPGTGKTLLAKAVATEGQAKTFMHIKLSSLSSKYVGESEKLVAMVFTVARENAPTVMFFDEIDALMGERSDSDHEVSQRVKNEMLDQIDGLSSNTASERLFILAATNLPWHIDSAFSRRMSRWIYIPLPCELARAQIIVGALNKLGGDNHTLSDSEINRIVERTDGWSGSDIARLINVAKNVKMLFLERATHFQQQGKWLVPCEEGAPAARKVTMRELTESGENTKIQLPPLSADDFESAFRKTGPTSKPDDIRRFEQFSGAT